MPTPVPMPLAESSATNHSMSLRQILRQTNTPPMATGFLKVEVPAARDGFGGTNASPASGSGGSPTVTGNNEMFLQRKDSIHIRGSTPGVSSPALPVSSSHDQGEKFGERGAAWGRQMVDKKLEQTLSRQMDGFSIIEEYDTSESEAVEVRKANTRGFKTKRPDLPQLRLSSSKSKSKSAGDRAHLRTVSAAPRVKISVKLKGDDQQPLASARGVLQPSSIAPISDLSSSRKPVLQQEASSARQGRSPGPASMPSVRLQDPKINFAKEGAALSKLFIRRRHAVATQTDMSTYVDRRELIETALSVTQDVQDLYKKVSYATDQSRFETEAAFVAQITTLKDKMEAWKAESRKAHTEKTNVLQRAAVTTIADELARAKDEWDRVSAERLNSLQAQLDMEKEESATKLELAARHRAMSEATLKSQHSNAVQQLERQITKSSVLIKELEFKISELQGDVSMHKEAADLAKLEATEAKSNWSDLRNQLRHANNAKASAEANARDASKKLADNLKSAQAQLQQQRQTLRKQKTLSSTTADSAVQTFIHTSTKATSTLELQTMLAPSPPPKEGMVSSSILSAVEEEAHALRLEKEDLKAQYKQTKQELEALQATIDTVKNDSTNAKTKGVLQNARAQTRIAALEQKNETLAKAAERDSTTITSLKAAVKKLQSQLDQASSDLSTTVADQEKTIKGLQDALDEQQGRTLELEDQILAFRKSYEHRGNSSMPVFGNIEETIPSDQQSMSSSSVEYSSGTSMGSDWSYSTSEDEEPTSDSEIEAQPSQFIELDDSNKTDLVTSSRGNVKKSFKIKSKSKASVHKQDSKIGEKGNKSDAREPKGEDSSETKIDQPSDQLVARKQAKKERKAKRSSRHRKRNEGSALNDDKDSLANSEMVMEKSKSKSKSKSVQKQSRSDKKKHKSSRIETKVSITPGSQEHERDQHETGQPGSSDEKVRVEPSYVEPQILEADATENSDITVEAAHIAEQPRTLKLPGEQVLQSTTAKQTEEVTALSQSPHHSSSNENTANEQNTILSSPPANNGSSPGSHVISSDIPSPIKKGNQNPTDFSALHQPTLEPSHAIVEAIPAMAEQENKAESVAGQEDAEEHESNSRIELPTEAPLPKNEQSKTNLPELLDETSRQQIGKEENSSYGAKVDSTSSQPTVNAIPDAKVTSASSDREKRHGAAKAVSVGMNNIGDGINASRTASMSSHRSAGGAPKGGRIHPRTKRISNPGKLDRNENDPVMRTRRVPTAPDPNELTLNINNVPVRVQSLEKTEVNSTSQQRVIRSRESARSKDKVTQNNFSAEVVGAHGQKSPPQQDSFVQSAAHRTDADDAESEKVVGSAVRRLPEMLVPPPEIPPPNIIPPQEPRSPGSPPVWQTDDHPLALASRQESIDGQMPANFLSSNEDYSHSHVTGRVVHVASKPQTRQVYGASVEAVTGEGLMPSANPKEGQTNGQEFSQKYINVDGAQPASTPPEVHEQHQPEEKPVSQLPQIDVSSRQGLAVGQAVVGGEGEIDRPRRSAAHVMPGRLAVGHPSAHRSSGKRFISTEGAREDKLHDESAGELGLGGTSIANSTSARGSIPEHPKNHQVSNQSLPGYNSQTVIASDIQSSVQKHTNHIFSEEQSLPPSGVLRRAEDMTPNASQQLTSGVSALALVRQSKKPDHSPAPPHSEHEFHPGESQERTFEPARGNHIEFPQKTVSPKLEVDSVALARTSVLELRRDDVDSASVTTEASLVSFEGLPHAGAEAAMRQQAHHWTNKGMPPNVWTLPNKLESKSSSSIPEEQQPSSNAQDGEQVCEDSDILADREALDPLSEPKQQVQAVISTSDPMKAIGTSDTVHEKGTSQLSRNEPEVAIKASFAEESVSQGAENSSRSLTSAGSDKPIEGEFTGATDSGDNLNTLDGLWTSNAEQEMLMINDEDNDFASEAIPGQSRGSLFSRHFISRESDINSISGWSPAPGSADPNA